MSRKEIQLHWLAQDAVDDLHRGIPDEELMFAVNGVETLVLRRLTDGDTRGVEALVKEAVEWHIVSYHVKMYAEHLVEEGKDE